MPKQDKHPQAPRESRGQQQRAAEEAIAAVPVRDIRHINTPCGIGDKDEHGNIEITFVVEPRVLHTYLLSPEALDGIQKVRSGLEIAPANAIPPEARPG